MNVFNQQQPQPRDTNRLLKRQFNKYLAELYKHPDTRAPAQLEADSAPNWTDLFGNR